MTTATRFNSFLEGKPSTEILNFPGVKCAFFESIEEASDHWDEISVPKNIFLSKVYLGALEANPPKTMRFGYLLFFQDNIPIGKAIFQVQHFKADQSIRREEDAKAPCFFNTFGKFIKGLVASRVEYDTLVCGSLLLTGQHGFDFDSNYITRRQQYALIEQGIEFVKIQFEKKGAKVSLMLIKDFIQYEQPYSRYFALKGFNEFTIQPNMIFHLDDRWSTFEEYLEAMTSKYRVRTKRARKKLMGLERKLLSHENLLEHESLMHDLYSEIAKNAGFNAMVLHPNYLRTLAETLPEQFRIFSYWKDGELIAYYTIVENGEEVEAHFLGFKQELNRPHQIYHNMLLDIVDYAIECGAKRVIFARTALEIKSSVGAVPYEMFCYLKHRNNFSNRFLNPILEYLKPDYGTWQQRHPFRDLPES